MEEGIAKKVIEDKITLGLVITSLIFFLLSAFNMFKISFGNNFLTQAISLFTPTIWIILAVVVLCSSILAYFKKYNLMAIVLLIALLSITAMIRTSNIDGLKDITTNDWTLGPDLDPFLYLRHAKEIANGTLQNPDMMRAAPLGFDNYAYKNLMPWAIVLIQKTVSIFVSINMTYAAIITPVIFFCISILGFFLFMYNLSLFKFSKKKALLIALLASILYSISPSMVGRTVAGDPEIESLGMIWFWFAFLFYTLAWKKDKLNLKVTFAILAGIFTGLMSWTWGGYRFIYMVIALTTLILFLFEKEQKKEKENLIIYSSWIIPALILEFLRLENILSILTRVSDSGFAFVVLLFLITNWIISKKGIKEKLEKINLPTSIISIISVALIIIIFLFIFNREMLFSIFSRLIEGFLYPWGRGRVGLTVAENRAPYFSEVLREFGNLVWVFLLGTIFLFYQAVRHFKKTEENDFGKWFFIGVAIVSLSILFYAGKIITGANYQTLVDQTDFLILLPLFLSLVAGIYFFTKKNINLSFNFSFLFFVLALIFSRISPQSVVLNGEVFFSKVLYFSGLIFFIGIIALSYILAYRNKEEHTLNHFKEINILYVLILAFSFWAIVSMRGAVRLFLIISPMVIIASSFVLAEVYEYKKNMNKKIFWTIFLFFILVFAQISTIYLLQTQQVSRGMIPSVYNQQWQSAMQWVRENTPKESIFVHWWDYGYWVQTLGERATVVDGGQPHEFWNHLVGRYILTAPAPEIALSIMKTQNVSYLLIDSSDIGKYPAFSKIGSNEGGEDRYSQIPTFLIDSKQTRETSNKTIRVYVGGGILDEDIIYTPEEENNSKEIFIPKENSYVIFMLFELTKKGNDTIIEQPNAIFIYNNQQISIPVRYLYYQGKLLDYKQGINATISLIPKIGNTVAETDESGAAIYLSPKVSKSALGQLYLLNNKEGRYSEFELVHSEQDQYITYLRTMGLNIGEFVYIPQGGGIRGPIKIWKINPDENILINKEFLRTSGEYAEFDNLTFVK